MSNSSTIVIGGGISGLTAAYLAQRRGEQVTLVEPEVPAGLVRTKRVDGFTLELGAATLVENTDFLDLLGGLGLADKIKCPAIANYRQYVWFGGTPIEVPKAPFKLLFKSPLIAPRDRFRILRALFWGRTDCSAEQNVRDFFTKLIGSSATDNILDPILSGIYGGNLQRLCPKSVFPDLAQEVGLGKSILSYMRARRKKSGGPKKIFMLEGGNDLLVEKLRAAGFSILKDRAKSISSEGSGKFTVGLETGHSLSGSKVFLATSAAASAQIIQNLNPQFARVLEQVSTVPLIVLHFEIPTSQALLEEGFGILFPSTARAKILGVMFNSSIFPHMAPVGRKLITVCMGGAMNLEILALSDERVLADCLTELRLKLNINQPKLLSLHRWASAIPQYNMGHTAVLQGMQLLEKQHPGLHFIGADRSGVGVGDRVRVAYEANSNS